MKKWLIYLGGIVTGVILVLVIIFIDNYDFSSNNEEEHKEKSIAENPVIPDNYLSTLSGEVYAEPGKIIKEKSFKVFQVLSPLAALVYGKSDGGGYFGTIYLLVTNKYEMLAGLASEFYDDQIVEVPNGKVVRMFGTHNYTTRDGRYKTVPRIMIVDK
jgi:hypothetical protein